MFSNYSPLQEQMSFSRKLRYIAIHYSYHELSKITCSYHYSSEAQLVHLNQSIQEYIK